MKSIARLALLGALAVVAALLLSACGSDPTATPTKEPTATPTATPTVGVGTPTPTPRPATPTPTATPVPTFDAAAYFSGHTIKMITGTSPGGGYDTLLRIFGKWARMSTRPSPEVLPGGHQVRGAEHTGSGPAPRIAGNAEG